MKVLLTIEKVVLGIVLLVPLSLIMLGLFGTVLGLAIALLRLAVIGLVAYGAFKLVVRLVRGPARTAEPRLMSSLNAADPYYEAAMRELDQELPETRRAR
jgi:hypothetical protein